MDNGAIARPAACTAAEASEEARPECFTTGIRSCDAEETYFDLGVIWNLGGQEELLASTGCGDGIACRWVDDEDTGSDLEPARSSNTAGNSTRTNGQISSGYASRAANG